MGNLASEAGNIRGDTRCYACITRGGFICYSGPGDSSW